MDIKSLFVIIPILFVNAECNIDSIPLNPMRAAKCFIPNGLEHTTRAVLLQQCLSKKYGQGNETRCYPELGCFPMNHPWVSLMRPFPSPLHPAEISTTLYCFTRDSKVEYEIKLWPEISLNGCPFSAERKTAFMTHGFASNGKFQWLERMKDNYLERVNANIFILDWGHGAELVNYLQAASNTRIVGAEVFRFIKYLIETHGLLPRDIHLLGHSLGAHIFSYVAMYTKEIKGIVDRITAFDPAQPGFEGESSRVRLDLSDASFIDAIHTNAAPFIPAFGFGHMTPIGHVDFYMNGGMFQPGCQIPNDIPRITSLSSLALFTAELIGFWVCCSHCRSYEYFIQALKQDCKIWGRRVTFSTHLISAGTMGLSDSLLSSTTKCDADSCIPLGLDTPNFKARGVFVANTRTFSPFCNDPATANRIMNEITHSPGSLFPFNPLGGLFNRDSPNFFGSNFSIGDGL